MEMQQTSWAIDKIHRVCFSYGADDGDVLQWCQETVVKVLKNEKNYVTVEIKWDRECLREGGSETSQDKLMRSKWNSREHEQGTWRETCIIWSKQQKIYKKSWDTIVKLLFMLRNYISFGRGVSKLPPKVVFLYYYCT
jgi:hypothetical protein